MNVHHTPSRGMPLSPPKFKTYTPTETLKRQFDKADAYRKSVVRAAERLTVGTENLPKVLALFGIGGLMDRPLLSDVRARKKAAKLLFRTTKRLFRALVPEDMPMYHITLVDDVGLTSDRKPSLKLSAMKRKVDKAIRALGLSGIVMIEVQALTNFPAMGDGRTLMLHAHALCWGAVSRRGFRAAMKKLNGSRSWRNTFGAKPIFSRRLKDGRDDALRIVSYLTKLPHDEKYRAPMGNGKFRFRPTTKGYPDSLALRIGEGLSHYSIFDAVFGVGEGKVIRKAWKSDLQAWHRQRMSNANRVCNFDVEALWRKLRIDSRYGPYEIG